MEISQLLIGILLFSAVIIGMSSFYTETANANGITITDYSYLNKTNDIADRLSTMSSALNNSYDPISSTLQAPTAVYNVLTLMLDLPSLFTNLLSDIQTATVNTLHIPAWAFQTVLAILTLLIVFGIINAIFGKKV